MSSGLLHVFVELRNLHWTSNYILYWIHRGRLSDSVRHDRVFLYCYSPVGKIEPATSRWLSPEKLREPTPITVTPCVLLYNSEWIFGIYKLNVLTWQELLLLCMIFYQCSYSVFFFFSSSLLNYRSPYCIQLYTWSTLQVIVVQHMCWFLKASNPPMFSPINYFNFVP